MIGRSKQRVTCIASATTLWRRSKAGCGPCIARWNCPARTRSKTPTPGAAVLAAYGFSPKGDLLAQILALNLAVAARIDNNQPVTAPGLPQTFPDPKRLITDDCIRP